MKSLKLALVGVALVLGMLTVCNASASADYGRASKEGYFSGTDHKPEDVYHGYLFKSTGDIPYQGISENWQTEPMTANLFISEMSKRLNSPSDVNAARAAVIINMMMGLNGTDSSFNAPSPDRWRNGVAVAKASFPKWESLVRSYAAGENGTSVIFNDFYNAIGPSDWLGIYNKDDVNEQYPDASYASLGSEAYTNDPAIIFYNPDGTVFNILKKCANIVGSSSPLQQPPVVVPVPPTPPPPPPTQPYFQAVGGDVVAGASFSTPNGAAIVPCSAAAHNVMAGIVSWNKRGTPNYAGAGGSYGVQAWNFVQDFVSGQGNGGEPSGLTFSNVATGGSIDPANGLYGGKFGAAPCLDYWGKKPATRLISFGGGSLNGLNGNYIHLGSNITLPASTIPNQRQITLYVEGDVAITGNITYASNNWANRTEIPSFRLIVHGSIYIAPSVTQLDGTYVAVPDSGYSTAKNEFTTPKAGTITTCSSASFASYNPNNYASSKIESACSNALTVNGSMIANQVWLLRARGSLASSTPAEVFNYTPDSWLATGDSSAGSTMNDYQSIIGLPPIL